MLNNITSNFEYDKIIYFSSLSHLSNKIFLEHKRNVENKIKTLNKKYIIIRSPNLFGNTGHHNNLIPYWVNCVKKSLSVNIYETFRSILDVSDLRRIVEYLLLDGFNGEIDINYIELIRPESLLDMISKTLKMTPKISKYVRGSDKFIINQYDDYVTHLLRELSIGEVGYTKKVLEKYYA